MIPDALHEGHVACPPRTPLSTPTPEAAPWVPQDPTHKRAAEAGRNRQRRQKAFLITGQPGLRYVRRILAGEAAGNSGNLGRSGAMPTNLARLLELSVTRNVETASRFE